MSALLAEWTAASTPLLTGIQQGQRPNALIETLSESLLETFRSHPEIASLIDPYGVYQHLMDYWAETLQGGKPNTDLIPPALIVARYFAPKQSAIE